MVRLVKGAYWDSEIKRAQVDGLPDYPVFTRKVHTDVAYLACAKAMLAAPDAIYPQFAIAQRVHDRGDPRAGRRRATTSSSACTAWARASTTRSSARTSSIARCRIYAPVGSHETLLAYLVRRLLENGANSSFVNRIVDPAVSIASLVVDPVALAEQGGGAPHANIPLPVAHAARAPQFARRRSRRRRDACRARRRARGGVRAARRGADPRRRLPTAPRARRSTIRNPADRDDVVGTVIEADGRRRRARRRDRAATRAAHGRRTPPPSARGVPRARGRSPRGGARDVRRARGARSRQDARQRHRRSARGGRLPAATTPRRRARELAAPGVAPIGPIVAHFAVEFSAGDLRRARSARRSRPAIRCSRSRPSRRR